MDSTVTFYLEPIFVDANTAARLLGICRSKFDRAVRAGVLPQPTRALGRPLWAVAGLRAAARGMVGLPVTETAEDPPIEFGL